MHIYLLTVQSGMSLSMPLNSTFESTRSYIGLIDYVNNELIQDVSI